MSQFAHEEIVLATGPYKGTRFRADRQPFSALLLDELTYGNWVEAYICGPSQSSKTLCALAIPTLYTIAELRENFVFGVPQDDMCDDKWRTDLLPVMASSPSLRRLIPTKGAGSQGGRVRDSVEFANGVLMKIMTRGSEDTGKAGFTARIVNVTEAAGWSKSTETSSAPDPLRQLRARQRSYARHQRRLIVEGTLTNHDELPWIARGNDDDDQLISTRSVLVAPCPHCPAWICPGRQHFKGWQDARTENEAIDNAHFVCPKCDGIISDDLRRASMQYVKLLHHGQHIDEHGQIIGERPGVSILWFHWSAYHNLLLGTADVAADEWLASQLDDDSETKEESEKELCQNVWSVPYEPPSLREVDLRPKRIRRRVATTEENILPADTTHVSIGIDLGKWTSWNVVAAGTESKRIVLPTYGGFTVCTNADDETEVMLLNALRRFRDEAIEIGFMKEDVGERVLPDEVWVDGQWMDDVARVFCLESNTGSVKYRVAHGFGTVQRRKYHEPKSKTQTIRYIGEKLYLERNKKVRRSVEAYFDADYWKQNVQRRIVTNVDKPGALLLFRSNKSNAHAQLSHHYANEVWQTVSKDKKGHVQEFVRRGQNHLLDGSAMALAALSCAGYTWRTVIDQSPAPSVSYFDRRRNGRQPLSA